MGLFGLFKGASKKPSNGPAYVMVKFCELGQPQPYDVSSEYVFRWAAPVPPQIGMRAIAPPESGSGALMVTHLGRRGDYRGEIKTITRLPTAAELRQGEREWQRYQAERQREREQREKARAKGMDKWLDLMRAEAGLPKKGWSLTVPDGFPAPPPAAGDASTDVANEYGRTWRQAFKNARDEEERARFEQIAKHWYGVRDSNRAMDARAALSGGRFKVKHWSEAFDVVTLLKREQRHDEALEVLRQCQESTIASDGGGLSPWPFEQAAIVLRKEKRLEDERAVIMDYLKRADDPDKRMVDRLLKVDEKLGR